MRPWAEKLLESVNFMVDGTVRPGKRLYFTLKTYYVLSTWLTITSHLYFMFKYTIKTNGGIVSISWIVHQLMELFLVFRCGGFGHQLTGLLNESNVELMKKFKFLFLVIMMSVALFTSFLVIYFTFNDAQLVCPVSFGIAQNELSDTRSELICYIVSFNHVTNTFSTILVLSARYSTIAYSITLFAQQNLLLMTNSTRDQIKNSDLWRQQRTNKSKDHFDHQFLFSEMERLYLASKELVEKLNSTYGSVPFWFLMLLYSNITTFGTIMVISNKICSTALFIFRYGGFICIILTLNLFLINLSNKCFNRMEAFRQKGLMLVNSRLKRTRVKDPVSECLANTLNGIPPVKMKAGQMYNLEYSLLISLIASAIPTTVMVVSLINESAKSLPLTLKSG